MSKPQLKAGTSGGVVTRVSDENSDRKASVVTVEGPYEDLKDASPGSFVPDGMTLIDSRLDPTGDGFATLTVRCVRFESSSSFSPTEIIVEVEMAEVQYDLEDHPSIDDDARDVILQWLATDETKRKGSDGYTYVDANGDLQTVPDGYAKKFCAAYMAGIKTFNRYFPVVTRSSTYANPPGMSMSGRSFTGGSPLFSANVGTYDDPPITLNGFPSGHWFKSKDSWRQNGKRNWTRAERWTYTPEASSGDNGWIYNDL